MAQQVARDDLEQYFAHGVELCVVNSPGGPNAPGFYFVTPHVGHGLIGLVGGFVFDRLVGDFVFERVHSILVRR
jgi:hypothetical protein